MNESGDGVEYFEVVIVATSPATDITAGPSCPRPIPDIP